jgi:hypothetical protein
MPDLISVSGDLAEKARIQAEKTQLRRMRYEAKTQRKTHHSSTELRYRDYPFVMWDGETPTDTGYSLFGSSDGHEICRPHLSTEECFELLLDAKRDNPHTIYFWYGGRYDWDEITRESIPLQKLARMKANNTLHWRGYRLTEIEGKSYKIQKGGTSVTLFEASGWFHSSYAHALRTYGIGTENCTRDSNPTGECTCQLCHIELGKSLRGADQGFSWADIEFIRKYMRLELALGPPLMDRIRKICLDAGFDLRSWYGPSALARQLLTRNKIFNCMAECPPEVSLAAQYGFAGGRFESFRGGIITEPLTEVDENSAYMNAALDLPNLARGSWREGREYEPGKFAIYNISYRDRDKPVDVTKPQPLFRRLENGTVCWPARVNGWYWAPEAELVKDDPGADFKKAWIFDEASMGDRPFTFVRELYAHRLQLQDLPDSDPSKAAELAIKWALAAVYGQLCRLVGWDKKHRKAPETHQLEWAGYITSKCRADMYRVAVGCGNRLVSIDTDSVTTIGEINNVPIGRQLGQWKASHYDGGVYFQSGVYFAKTADAWAKGKARGTEKRQNNTAGMSPDLLSDAIREGLPIRLSPRRKYITTRMALNGQLDSHGQWIEHPGNILVFGGGGKRYHNPRFCERYCMGSVHVFLPTPASCRQCDIFDCSSVPHLLPWKNDCSHSIDVKLLEDILWIDTEAIDFPDDVWQAELVRKEYNARRQQLSGADRYQDQSDVVSELSG